LKKRKKGDDEPSLIPEGDGEVGAGNAENEI
jgi:hypothetical protein